MGTSRAALCLTLEGSSIWTQLLQRTSVPRMHVGVVGPEERQADAGEQMKILGLQVKPVTHEERCHEWKLLMVKGVQGWRGCYRQNLNEGHFFF